MYLSIPVFSYLSVNQSSSELLFLFCNFHFFKNLWLFYFQMPVQSGATKHFCCWCCKSGPLSAMVRLDRKSHVPGEKMVISAEITNLSDRNITKSKAILEMVISISLFFSFLSLFYKPVFNHKNWPCFTSYLC